MRSSRTVRRRVATSLLVALLLAGACSRARPDGPSIIVMGIDGLDHRLVRELIDAGRLPNLARMEAASGLTALETAATPQSPVAWSNFITGLDSGGHGIFDFLHRDLSTASPFGIPYQSMTRELPAGFAPSIGGWVFPLTGGGIELARHGTPFWQLLEDNGIESTIVRMPANFPPVGVGTRELSGMGTPDLRGSSGEFTFFSTDRRQFMKTGVTGGAIHPVDIVDDSFRATLYGPDDNPLTVEENDPLTAEFTVWLDPDEEVAKFQVGSEEFILRAGEWSEWVAVDFELMPYLAGMSGAVRFYLKSVRPDLNLYVTPIQIDPANAAMPISEPASFASELAEATGRFYTQEMPEDTRAIQWGVFDIDDFLRQTTLAREETIAQYRHLLDTWNGGFLFTYFGSADQVSHVLWGVTRDPGHPAHDPDRHGAYTDVIPQIYEEFDALVGETLDRIDDDTILIVMSDHGFRSWRRSFHLNTWLLENGYMNLQRRASLPIREVFAGVDWRRTEAYGLGISALYLNIRGREPQGIVAPGDRDELLQRLERDLLATIDPFTGQPAVTRVYIRERDFKDRGHLEVGPDMVIGYAAGTRGSGANALGGLPETPISDNTDEWSGDHIMDHTTVPGVLLSSRPLARGATSLQNLAAAILAELGIEGFPDGSVPVTVDEN